MIKTSIQELEHPLDEPSPKEGAVTIELHGVFTHWQLRQIVRRMDRKLDWDSIMCVAIFSVMVVFACSVLVFAARLPCHMLKG